MKHLLTKFKYYNAEEERNRKYIVNVILCSEIPEYKEAKRVFFCQHRYILGVLTERGAEVLSLYYGLDDVIKSYGEVAADIEVTKERVRQILLKVFRKLRHPVIVSCLSHFNDLEIGCDRSNYKEFNMDKLNEVYKQRLEAKGLERFETLSDKEKEADILLDKILQTRPGMLNIFPIDRIVKWTYYGNMSTLLSISEEEFKKEENVELVNQVHALGLYFYCEFEYEEEWLNKCRAGIINVGIENIENILSTISSNDFKFKELLETPIAELDLSVRAFNCLWRARVEMVEDMIKLSENDYIKIRNLGRTVLDEIQKKLQSLGLDFRPENVEAEKWIEELARKHNVIFEEEGEQVEEQNINITEDRFNALMETYLEDLDFSVRTHNALKKSGVDCLEDIVSRSERELFRVRNLGRRCFDEIVEKLDSMNLSLRPERIEVEDWLKTLRDNNTNAQVDDEETEVKQNQRLISKILERDIQSSNDNELYPDPVDAVVVDDTQNVSTELDINEIPEKYRRVYSIGAGVEAERQVKKELSERLFVNAIIKNAQPKLNVEADKHSVPKIKLPKQDINQLSDSETLKAIEQDIEIMTELDNNFIERYKRELTIIILENNTINTNKKLDLIEFVNNVNSYSV